MSAETRECSMTRPDNHPRSILKSFVPAAAALLLFPAGEAAVAMDTQAAEAAGTPVVLQDERFSIDCTVAAVQMGADGSLVLEESTCSTLVTAGETGTLKFSTGGQTTHSCTFEGMTMDAQGHMTVRTTGSCFADSDLDEIPDSLDPFSQEKATAECLLQGESPDESVSLSAANYGADATCALPAPNRLVAANTAVGAVDVAANVDFRATDGIDVLGATVAGGSVFTLGGDDQGRPTVRIWGPFSVKAGSVFAVHP